MNLRSLFKRKKKKKDEPEVTIFGEVIEEELEESPRLELRKSFKKAFSFLKPKRKLRIGFLLKFKRITAGFLFILYLLASFMLIPELYAVMFFATAFILLDYLWKTRRVQWVKDDQ